MYHVRFVLLFILFYTGMRVAKEVTRTSMRSSHLSSLLSP